VHRYVQARHAKLFDKCHIERVPKRNEQYRASYQQRHELRLSTFRVPLWRFICEYQNNKLHTSSEFTNATADTWRCARWRSANSLALTTNETRPISRNPQSQARREILARLVSACTIAGSFGAPCSSTTSRFATHTVGVSLTFGCEGTVREMGTKEGQSEAGAVKHTV
jgi:hypothetical protein